MNKVILRPKRDFSIRSRHPWIFSGAIAKMPADAASLRPGETVETEAAAVFSDESGLWQFRCRSSVDGEPAAEAILTLFSPPEDYFDQYRS